MATVVTYRDRYRPDFERLNRQWIESYFVLEEPDLEAFRERRAARSSSSWTAIGPSGRVR